MESKRILTADIVSASLKAQYTGKSFFGVLLCAAAAIILVNCIFGIAEGEGFFAGYTFVAGAVFLYFGVRKLKAASRNRANVQAGNYRVVRTRCISLTDGSDCDGNVFTAKLENGDCVSDTYPPGAVGDPFYLIYLDGVKAPAAFFNGSIWVLSDDLRVRECASR